MIIEIIDLKPKFLDLGLEIILNGVVTTKDVSYRDTFTKLHS